MRIVDWAKILTPTFILTLFAPCAFGVDYPLTVKDSGGNEVVVRTKPQRIVSVSPTATDVLCAVGAADLLVGRTYYSSYPPVLTEKTVVGGFLRPSIEAVERLKPDLIFFYRIQKDLRDNFAQSDVALVEVGSRSMVDAYRVMELIGRIVDKERQAEELVGRIRGQVDHVRRKVAKIPEERRKRVMRLMGRAQIMTPGDDSFQNEFIRAAGGIPPSLGKDGAAAIMTKEEWEAFNPQLIYYCGDEWKLSEQYFDKPGWKDVDAVRNRNYAHFPCDFTCRASVHMGDFIAWLASVIYPEEFSRKETAVSEDTLLGSESVRLFLPYVKSAVIQETIFLDFPNRTLLIDFTEPMRCLSSLEGPLDAAESVGNHSLPFPLWHICHQFSISRLKEKLCHVLKHDPEHTGLLFTGARMESLSAQEQSYKDMQVYALVTAGAQTNAIRSGVDVGNFYEPGTINIIILTNMRLTPRAMTRAIIAATEAKTAALQDLDVRSSYSPRVQATGTGTDNIIVVEGRGPSIDNSGGHSKMGELIAKAVHAGVTDSLRKQNSLVAQRSIFRRMKERNIDVYGIVSKCIGVPRKHSPGLSTKLETLLLDPGYAGFLETAFALDDAHTRNLICDLTEFERSCAHVQDRIAGRSVTEPKRFLPDDGVPDVVRMALDAFLNGLDAQSDEAKNRTAETSSPPAKRVRDARR